MHALRASATKVALLHGPTHHGVHGVLGGNDHLGAAACLLHPLPDPLLALPALVDVGRVDEVATEVVIGVEELKALLLGAFTHHPPPGGAQACLAVSVALEMESEEQVTYSCRPRTAGSREQTPRGRGGGVSPADSSAWAVLGEPLSPLVVVLLLLSLVVFGSVGYERLSDQAWRGSALAMCFGGAGLVGCSREFSSVIVGTVFCV